MLGLLLALGALAQDADRQAIVAVIDANQEAFDRCYTLATDDVPWASGHVMVGFEVDAKGRVSGASVRNECLFHTKAEKCMIERLEQLPFEPPASGKAVRVIYPWLFVPYQSAPPEVAKVEKAIGKCQAKAGSSGLVHVKVQYELARGFTRPISQRVLDSGVPEEVPAACIEKAAAKMRFSGDFEGKVAHTFVQDGT